MFTLVRCDRTDRSCARCQEPLVEGAAIVQNLVGWDDPEHPHLRLHPRCAVDVSSYYARLALGHSHLDFPERAALLSLAEARWAAIEAARTKGAPRPEIGPASDPWGRPRVTVLLAGSALGDREWAKFAKARPLLSWRSERREYVFDRVVKKLLVVDPSQPVVAGVFAIAAGGKVVRSHREHLTTWKTLGLPAPLVWTFGATNGAQEQYLCAQVSAAGWALDAVTLVPGSAEVGDFDEPAMRTLGRALDQVTDLDARP